MRCNAQRVITLQILFTFFFLGATSVLFSYEETWSDAMEKMLRDVAKQTTKNHQSNSEILKKEIPNLAKRIEHLELTLCHVVNWMSVGPRLEARTFADDLEYVSFIDERLRGHTDIIERYVERVMKELKVPLDNHTVEVSIRKLATRVAANEQSIGLLQVDNSRISQKLESVRSMVVENWKHVENAKEAVLLAQRQYNTQSEGFCARLEEYNKILGQQSAQISDLKRRIEQLETGKVTQAKLETSTISTYSTLRPTIQPDQLKSTITIDEIVQNRAHFCAQAELSARARIT